ncbi:retroviral-like aspartic protease family protein, partial [Magnetococcales bacterium HHB-1]
ANGIGYGAPVTLRSLQVGDLIINNISATVNRAAMSESLLGMRFFNRLKEYRVAQDRLELYW